MALTERDELRHDAHDDPLWRESVYWNFGVPELNLGGWIYAWVTPHKSLRSGMMVSLYRGMLDDASLPERALAAPDHWAHQDPDRSLYFVTREIPELVSDDFDDFGIEGLQLRRVEPLEHSRIEFDDGAGTALGLDCHYLTPPWDYRDNVEPTPSYLADNRYHRGWRGSGELILAGARYPIDVTGDSDHSWGRRDEDGFFDERCWKMWSTQVPDGKVLSVIALGPDRAETCYGFIRHGGVCHAVAAFEERPSYDEQGVKVATEVTFRDVSGETTHCRAEPYANLALERSGFYWGNEGPARYVVDGRDTANGILSNFWPIGIRRGNPPR